MNDSSSLWSRLVRLVRGFFGAALDDVEKQHPRIAYDNAVQTMIEKYERLKASAAVIVRRREDLDQRLAKEREELTTVARELELAVDTSRDDLALALIEKRDLGVAEVTRLTAELEQARRDADDVKDALVSFKAEIGKLKLERDRMLARLAGAQARLQVDEQLDGLSLDAEVRALDNVREHIGNTLAAAKLRQELSATDLTKRLAGLRKDVAQERVRDELQRLKAARAVKLVGSGERVEDDAVVKVRHEPAPPLRLTPGRSD